MLRLIVQIKKSIFVEIFCFLQITNFLQKSGPSGRQRRFYGLFTLEPSLSKINRKNERNNVEFIYILIYFILG